MMLVYYCNLYDTGVLTGIFIGSNACRNLHNLSYFFLKAVEVFYAHDLYKYHTYGIFFCPLKRNSHTFNIIGNEKKIKPISKSI